MEAKAPRECGIAAPSTLIFDMDGVLVDSEPLHKRAKIETFRRFGIVLPDSVYDNYKGQPDKTMMVEIVRDRPGLATADELLRVKREIFEANEHEMQAVPGALDFLDWAAARYQVGLGTSSTPRNRAAILEILGVSDVFKVIVDSSHFQRPKPDPEVFLIAMRELGVEPANCWIIEDSVNGVQAGKAAGCIVVAITTTFDSAKLREAGADIIVDSFAELRARIEALEAPQSSAVNC